MASGSSLNSVVNSLVRASMGASVSPTVTNEDLDRHVAELILKEAKAKAEKYAKEGIRAYLPQTGYADSSVPKTNKRFLTSLVKNVSDHNKVIIQAQAEAAEQVKEAKRQEEMRDRRRRAEEAVDDRMRVHRLFSQGLRSSGDSWKDRDRRRDEGRSERRSRSPRRRDRDSRRSPSPRRRSRSPRRRSRSPSRKHRSSRDEHKSEHKHRRRDRSQSVDDERPSKRRSDRKRDSERSKHDSDADAKRSRKEKGKDRADDTPHRGGSSLTPEPVGPMPASSSSRRSTRSPSPAHIDPSGATTYSSKMDKYFSPSYDPLTDIDQPSVNKTGLLEGPQWEGWEGMLELMRLRAQDKEEKKRREREDREKDKFDRKRAKEKGLSSLSSSVALASTEEVGLMDIKYKKRGAVKEWDLAKETPT
ncbi:unnamed protein product [Rhizoctonia solani]|uniref:Uncharacterized protein n=1 Tax=Rhizoctonia solani TaxID=456999 RepID=A0A8H3E8K3_9AGAM|nr:unnamed protein product [Rhizoctonia solani]